MLVDQTQKYGIKVNGTVTNTYNTSEEAQYSLFSLKQSHPGLYETAMIVLVDNNNKEFLLG
jgi:hypothetical protein